MQPTIAHLLDRVSRVLGAESIAPSPRAKALGDFFDEWELTLDEDTCRTIYRAHMPLLEPDGTVRGKALWVKYMMDMLSSNMLPWSSSHRTMNLCILRLPPRLQAAMTATALDTDAMQESDIPTGMRVLEPVVEYYSDTHRAQCEHVLESLRIAASFRVFVTALFRAIYPRCSITHYERRELAPTRTRPGYTSSSISTYPGRSFSLRTELRRAHLPFSMALLVDLRI